MAYNLVLSLYGEMKVCAIKEKKSFMIVVKDSKDDFICGDSYRAGLQRRKEIRLNSKYKEMQEFIAKEDRKFIAKFSG